MAATPFMPVEDTQPEKGLASEVPNLLASVSSATILVVIVFVSLMMVFHKMSRNKGKINAKVCTPSTATQKRTNVIVKMTGKYLTQ